MNKSQVIMAFIVFFCFVGCTNGEAQIEEFPTHEEATMSVFDEGNEIQVFSDSETFVETGPLLVELQYTWLSVQNFQKLTTNEQNAIVAAARDVVVLSLHSMKRHELETCVMEISPDELEALKNTMLEIAADDPRFTNSVVGGLVSLQVQLCSIPTKEPKTPKDSEEKPEKPVKPEEA